MPASSPASTKGPAGSGSPSPERSSGTGRGSSGSAACVTTAWRASCGPFYDPQIQRTNSDPTVSNDVWNPISGWQQELFANSPGDWHTVVTGPAGNTSAVSYPSSGSSYPESSLSSLPALYSSFSENMHPQGGTSAEAAYDVWLNNWQNEVMIQHDIVNLGTCPTLATVTFGGSHGVPVQKWKLCQYRSELIWQLTGAGEQTGSVDILAMLNWLASHKYLPRSNGLTAVGYGFEICSTGGKPEAFTVTSFSITR